MARALPDMPEAWRTRERIAELCNLELEFGRLHLPEMEIDPGQDRRTSTWPTCCRAGAGAALRPRRPRRSKSGWTTSWRSSQKTQFANYFLVVWDIVSFARRAEASPAACAAAPRPASILLLPGHHRHRPAGTQAGLRALPQHRAQGDAGYRHGLPGRPPRRGHRVRRPEVRPRPRGPDHHLRHAGRPGRPPRRRPGAGHDLRPRSTGWPAGPVRPRT